MYLDNFWRIVIGIFSVLSMHFSTIRSFAKVKDCIHKFKSDLLRNLITLGESFAEIIMVKILFSF